jgi:hypothetical protein
MLGLNLATAYAASLSSGPAFTPLSLAPAAWYDFSDLSTMFQTGTRGSPGAAVAADGDPVGLILDKSGNNKDLVQAVTTKRPLYHTDGTLKWIAFDGADDFLRCTTLALSQPDYVYLAHQQSSVGAAQAFFDGVSAEQTAFNSPTTLTYNAGSGVNSGIAANTAAAVDGYVFNGASSTARRNGVAGTGGNAGAAALSDVTIGCTNIFTAFYFGKMFGIVIGSGALASPAKLETYLGAKAGLVL